MLRQTGLVCLLLVALNFSTAHAANEQKLPFNFENAEITKVLSTYSKASGKKFVIDPSVRGKISILTAGPVSLDEAFALLSTGLAVNQYAIVEQGDTMVVMSARNAQRSMIPTVTELPPVKPEKMISMIFTLKYITPDEVNKRLRILPSKDGEMSPFDPNKLIVTDWVTNVHRIAQLIEQVDQPSSAAKPATK